MKGEDFWILSLFFFLTPSSFLVLDLFRFLLPFFVPKPETGHSLDPSKGNEDPFCGEWNKRVLFLGQSLRGSTKGDLRRRLRSLLRTLSKSSQIKQNRNKKEENKER